MTVVDAPPSTAVPSTHFVHEDGRHIHKSIVLVIVAIAQLMVVLDATIVNVAIPSIGKALDVTSSADLSWIVTGYTLTFGGFLLLGGKLADRFGRRLIFMTGATLFATASLIGGLSQSLGPLIGARAVQGLGGALMAPAALSIITVVFREGDERNRALGIWAAITAGGAAIGLIMGGLLTEYASWRWVFFVNVPIAIFAIVGALRFVPESRDERPQGFDIPGAVLVTSGLMALVYGLVKGNAYGWGSFKELWILGLAAVLLVAFLQVQVVSKNPLVPFELFRSKTVVGADIGSLFIGAGIFAIFFFLVLWMQTINGWSPIRAGVAFLPMTVIIGVSAGISSKLLGRVGPRPLLLIGPLFASFGLLQLALRLEVHSSYWTVVLPALACVAFGMGMTFVSLTSSAVAGVPHEDAGMASALLNSGQQIGGALGLAIVTAVSTTHTANQFPQHDQVAHQAQLWLVTHPHLPFPAELGALYAKLQEALVSGWAAGFLVGSGLLATAAVIMRLLIHVGPADAAKALKETQAAG